jgi:hypothetical protein
VSELGGSAELVDELILEATKEGEAGRESPRWHKLVALSTLVLALLTAVGALLAGITAHEAVLERTEQAIEVSVLEGDRVTVEVLKAKHEILSSLGEAPDPYEIALIEAYEEQMAELFEETAYEEGRVEEASSAHLILAVAVTVLSIGITLCGMSVVIEQKWLWIAGLAIGLVGAVGLAIGILSRVT